MRFSGLLVGVAVLLLGSLAQAQPQSGEARATFLQSNVVKIAATLIPGVPQIGFGFVVGQQSDQLVIVTADHVVRGEDADGKDVEDRSPVITFFESQGYQVHGTLQTVRMPKDHGDLAVILVPRPSFVTYQTAAISMETPARGTQVWLVGRGGDWNIPTAPGIVAQYDPFGLRIKVENLPAAVGSSGGPLISAEGIVGMIIVDSGLSTEATPIEPIQRQVRDVWHYDWRLTPTPPAIAPSHFSQSLPASGLPAPGVPAPGVPAAQAQPPSPSPTVVVPSWPNPVSPPAPLTAKRRPSYSCTDVLKPVEALICEDSSLSLLDIELNGVYQSLRSRINAAQQAQLRSSQLAWLRTRDSCLQAPRAPDMKACLSRSYRSRIESLR